MAVTPINSEDRLVQATFARHLEQVLGWDSVYAWKEEAFGPDGTLGRADTREAVLARDLRAALERLNPGLPATAIDDAIRTLTVYEVSRSTVQHNREFFRLIRGGVPVEYRDAQGRQKAARARVIDFDNAPGSNRFLAVRELKLTGIRTPNYNRRADLICFVNGLPLVFIELKAVYRNIREGFDNNLSDYLDENVIAHAFHHNAFLIVSNGDRARYGSITGGWEHFLEWKRLDEADKGSLDAEVMLNGMLAHERLLDIVESFILFDESKPGATRKVIARNHQVLGVNRAVASVARQEELKREFPPGRRLRHRVVELSLESRSPAADPPALPMAAEPPPPPYVAKQPVAIVERAHPDLGRLGVFWHTQGSGKSYSMAFFAEKVRRKLEGNFTFLLMTDRNDLDGQIYRTFVGCGIADDNTPRAKSGRQSGAAAQREPPLRLQPHPQVQQGRRSETALQRARRHHRDLRRGASHAGGATGPQHAPRTAERGLHRLHRHASLQAGRDHEAHLRELRLALRLQALGGGRRHRQARLREPGREAGRGADRSQRPHRGENRRGRARSRPGGAARQAAGPGLRGRHRRRAPGQDRGRLRRALRDPVAVGQVDAGVHRQDHLRPDAPAARPAMGGQGGPPSAGRRTPGVRKRRRRATNPSAPRWPRKPRRWPPRPRGWTRPSSR